MRELVSNCIGVLKQWEEVNTNMVPIANANSPINFAGMHYLFCPHHDDAPYALICERHELTQQ